MKAENKLCELCEPNANPAKRDELRTDLKSVEWKLANGSGK